jgi:hypothetical protein
MLHSSGISSQEGCLVTDEDAAAERWYDATDDAELMAFLTALWSATDAFRRTRPDAWLAQDAPPDWRHVLMRARLWTAISGRGGSYDRGAWVRIVSVPEEHVVVRQRQLDGSDEIFELTADAMHQLML